MANNEKKASLPTEFVDCHHHFVDTATNEFQSFLGSLLPNEQYLAEAYEKDVVKPLAEAGVSLLGGVHMECMPDDGVKEVSWVESMESTVKAIVASCDLASESVDEELIKLKDASPKLRGVRWIIDSVGPFEKGTTATHVATVRFDSIDYLRGSEGGHDGGPIPAFEKGFASLAKHQLTFDLQCAPAQLLQAAQLCSRHPNVRVCIDHLGKPRILLGPDVPSNDNTIPNDEELQTWREGMKAMAKHPQVYVKVSMLGYAVPGWIRKPERIQLVKELCREVVEMFGPSRCMIGLNWWKDGACSDSDGVTDIGPSPVEFLQYMSDFFSDYSEEDRHRLFVGTAKEFYRI